MPDKRAWTTQWRGDSYTVASFPYVRYVNVWFSGTDDYDGCITNNDTFGDFFANQWCGPTAVKGWPFWENYSDTVDDNGTQLNLVCGKEVIIGAAAAGAGFAVASIWTGPGAVAAAGIGAASGATEELIRCGLNHLWDKVF